MKLFEINHLVDPVDAANQIAIHCKPFLEQISYKAAQYPMYRGTYTKDRVHMAVNPATGLRTIRGYNPNRKPVDTPIEIHNEINRVFTAQYGVPFRNGTFATGKYVDASGYGNLTLIVLPIGEFKFLWSPKFSDLWIATERVRKQIRMKYNRQDVEDKAAEIVAQVLSVADYKTTDLPTAISSNKEIMLYCDSCIVLRADADNPLAVLQEIQNRGA